MANGKPTKAMQFPELDGKANAAIDALARRMSKAVHPWSDDETQVFRGHMFDVSVPGEVVKSTGQTKSVPLWWFYRELAKAALHG